MTILWIIIGIIIGFIIGFIIAFFLVKKMFKKQLYDNPPINEKMIRMLYARAGRKPKESQIQKDMRDILKEQENSYKK